MKTTNYLIVLLLLMFLSSGCATMDKRINCAVKGAVAGALIGGGAGAVIANQGPHETDNNKQEGALVGAAAGGVIGGVVGFMVCKDTGPDDTDGDGVPDDDDKCPGTPLGIEVDENGCPKDTDGDGVPDYKDKCPDTPKGVAVDENGCPKDTDGDGVPDYKDKCPDTPEGTRVDQDGCPLVGEKLAILNINFNFDTARITQDSEEILDRNIAVLKKNETIRVRIEGHTDNIGTDAYNLGLSQRRAQSVKDYLVSEGIAEERLELEGKGEKFPIATNETQMGRDKNRRVEFIVISK
jgi:OOP family OmpA-OmpF porin